jgi:putative transposase
MKTRAYKYKMKPTFKQQECLNKAFGCCRFIYNWGLDKKIQSYKQEKKTIGYVELAHELTKLKNDGEHEWLKEVNNTSLQQSLRNLDAAFVRFFREKKGFPKFKSKKKNIESAKYINAVHFDFDNWKVKIPKCGWVKLCKNKTFDLSMKYGTLTVSKDKCGGYWCSIVVYDVEEKPKTKVSIDNSVGIDLGIKDYAILSDGTKYGNPKFLEKGQKRLKTLQQRFARTQKKSNRHEALRLKVAKCHRDITNKRNDFLHKLSTLLVKYYDTICLEDLNVEGMMKNHHLSNSIQSAAWSEFVRQLKYKSDWYGKNVIFIGRFEPSSKTCSKCGYVKSDLQLSDREWVCPKCGEKHDRDVNAAINIRDFALHKQNLIGIENNELKPVGKRD